MTQPENFSGTVKENLRATRILCASLITGLLIFVFVTIFISKFNGPYIEETNQYSDILLWVVAIVSSICILSAKQQYSKRIVIVKSSAFTLNEKLNQYRAALIVYMALCEGPALFSIIVFLLSGNFYVLIVTIIIVAIMLTKYPGARRVINELELNFQEQQQLE